MGIKKSPTYWEELSRMDAPELRAAFRECAALDLGWAIDQAKCLSYHLAPNSAASGVLREFCNQAAGKALRNGTADMAITALQIVADAPDAARDDRAQAAVKDLRRALDGLAETDPDRALGMAVLLKAKSWQNEALKGELIDFILSRAPADAGGLLMNVVRRGEDLSAPQLEKIIEKTVKLAVHKPYEAHNIILEMLGGCQNLTTAQCVKLTDLSSALAESPAVMLDILEREYGEDVSALRNKEDKLANYIPAPGSMSLN